MVKAIQMMATVMPSSFVFIDRGLVDNLILLSYNQKLRRA